MKEHAISEVVGTITLIAIIGTAFFLFAVLYLPTIEPEKIPHIQLIMGCHSYDIVNDPLNKDIADFNCDAGLFSCPPDMNKFKSDCQEDCRRRSLLGEKISESRIEYNNCLDDCNEYCGDLNPCNFLFICHTNGESIELSRIKIFVNGNPISPNRWYLKAPRKEVFPESFIQVGNDFSLVPISMKSFTLGDTIMISLQGEEAIIKEAIITYNSPEGGEYILTQNLFGN